MSYPNSMELSSNEAQEVSLAMPTQDLLVDKEHEVATILNSQAKPEAKETDPNIVELDSENYGAPPEGSGIKVNVENASLTEPQAWEDEHGNWFYNFAGALQLAKVLGRTLPNIDQLIAAIRANPDNFHQNAGYRDGDYSKFYKRGKHSGYWSSSENGFILACYAYLEQGASSINHYWNDRRDGFFVRFIVDKRK